jgi:hypothetical protein
VGGFAGLAQGYSTASHIQHADYVGVSTPLDRDRRAADRRDAIHLAHLARLVSDALSCLRMRLVAGYRYIDHDSSSISEATEKINCVCNSFGDPYERWMDIEYGDATEDSDTED